MWRRLAGAYEQVGAYEQAQATWVRLRDLHRERTELSGEAVEDAAVKVKAIVDGGGGI